MKNKIIGLSILFLFIAGNLFADTILLKSGKEVQCKILEKTSESVKVDFDGVELTYFLSDIDKINNEAVSLAVPAQLPAVENVPALPIAPNPQIKEENSVSVPEALKPNIVTQNPAKNPETKDLLAIKAQINALTDSQKQKFYGGVLAVIVIFIICILIFYIFTSLCLQIIAKKTNNEPAWLAWIPIGNLFLMCKIGTVSYWWLLGFLLGFIPYIGFVTNSALIIYLLYKIAIVRNKPGWMALLVIIPIVGPFIVWGYLAFKDN